MSLLSASQIIAINDYIKKCFILSLLSLFGLQACSPNVHENLKARECTLKSKASYQSMLSLDNNLIVLLVIYHYRLSLESLKVAQEDLGKYFKPQSNKGEDLNWW
uniref:Uncharacterized protein n=1 Tax=Triticum urartu TaxID=4572 RepID=A0A8R7R240_TRIUA